MATAILERLRGLVARDSQAVSAVVKLGPFGSYNAWAWNYTRLTKSVFGNPTGNRCVQLIGNNFCRPNWMVKKPGTTEALPEHPFLDVLNHPEKRGRTAEGQYSPGRSGTSLQATISRDLELNGRSFWLPMQGKDGFGNTGPPTGLKRLMPQRVTVVANMEDELIGFIYQPRSGGRIPILPENVMFLRFPHPEREFDGIPPAMIAGLPAELDSGAARFNSDLLANDAGLPGYLVVEGLTRNLFQEWKASWEAGENPGKIRFLGAPGASGGKVTFVRTALSNQEMAYHDLRMDAQADMCFAFGVPKVLLDPTDSTFANMDKAMLTLIRYTVLPKWTMVADDITIQFGLDQGVEVGFDLSEIEELQEAETEKAERAKLLLELDAMVINEWREAEGLDPLPWGNYALSFLRQLTAPAVAGMPSMLPTELLAGMGGGLTKPQDEAIQKALAQRRRDLRTLAEAMPSAYAALTKAFDPRLEGAVLLKGASSFATSLEGPKEEAGASLELAAVTNLRTKAGRRDYYRRWDRRIRTHEAAIARKMGRFFARQKTVVVARLRAQGSKSVRATKANGSWWDDERWKRELGEEASGWLNDVVDSFGTWTMDDLAAEGFNPSDPEVTDWLDLNGGRISEQVNTTTFEALSGLIGELTTGGSALSAIVDAVSGWFDDQDGRPDLVASAEVVPAANFGAATAATQSDENLTKMWVTAGDDSVDEECDAHDGEEVGLDEEFGDGDVPGDVHFGCRCTTVYLKVTPDEGDSSEAPADTGSEADTGDGGE